MKTLICELNNQEIINLNGGGAAGPIASYYMSDYAVDAIGSWFHGVWDGFWGEK